MALIQNFYHQEKHYGLNLAFCGMEDCPSGHVFGPSIRAHYLFHYVTKGKGTYTVGNTSYQLSSGQGFLINPSDVTTYAADTDDPWSYIWIAFDGNDAETLMTQCGFSRTNHIYTCSQDDNLIHVLKALLHHSGEPRDHYFNQIARLYQVFAIISKDVPQDTPIQTDYIVTAINFIEHNYAYAIKITDIANVIGLERSYLYRKFLAETGQSPKTYLINHRLKIAKKLLLEGKLSITEIAYSCGFKSSSAFHKHFKRAYDQTPKDYLRNM